jgi:predicted ATPase
LRSATSLARLWQKQGQSDRALALLAPVYQQFNEGFETADLLAAKNTLDDRPPI